MLQDYQTQDLVDLSTLEELLSFMDSRKIESLVASLHKSMCADLVAEEFDIGAYAHKHKGAMLALGLSGPIEDLEKITSLDRKQALDHVAHIVLPKVFLSAVCILKAAYKQELNILC